MSTSTKVLVTGSHGFIGKAVVAALEREGFTVRDYDKQIGEDIENKGILELAFLNSKPDVVVHLAGVLGTSELISDPVTAVRVNIEGTLNVLDLVRKYGCKLVYISKPSVWLNPYTITKTAAEQFVQMYHREFHIPTLVLKLFNVYGPGQLSKHVRKAVPYFIECALKGEPLEVYGDGEQVCDLVYVDDVADAIVAGIWKLDAASGRIIEIGSGMEVSVLRLAEIIIEITQSKSKIILTPMRPGEGPDGLVKADPLPAYESLNWATAWEPLEGLQRTVEWHRERLGL